MITHDTKGIRSKTVMGEIDIRAIRIPSFLKTSAKKSLSFLKNTTSNDVRFDILALYLKYLIY
jgi:hypothetical protein